MCVVFSHLLFYYKCELLLHGHAFHSYLLDKSSQQWSELIKIPISSGDLVANQSCLQVRKVLLAIKL